MPDDLALAALLLSSLIIPLGGCARASPDPGAAAPPLVWGEKDIEFRGATIDLGFRDAALSAGRSVEPVATITRNGASVPGAMVFIALIPSPGSASDNERLIDEAPARYEPPGQQSPALFTAGELPLPEGAAPPAVRFRIVLPDADEDFTREIPLP
jgi:hypothetical protein